MRQILLLSLVGTLILGTGLAELEPASVEHVVVYKEEGRFAGWPANHGIWSWGDEIAVGFEIGYFRQTERGHAIDYTKPAQHAIARSLDGGKSWNIEVPEGLRVPEGLEIAGVPAGEGGRQPVEAPGGIPFADPGFALTARMADIHIGPSRFYYSTDRARTWQGPFKLPDFGQPGIAARTDYLVDGPETMTMFLTAAKSNRLEGRVICVRTMDGGGSWEMVSFVGPEPADDDYAIMPSTVRISDREFYTTVRHRGWIEGFRSIDNGASWISEGNVADAGRGNPPSLVKMKDGRLAMVYGYRKEPYGIRAKISSDNGKTWGEETVLRDDGGNWDLGYPRTVQRPDGKLVSVYYYNEDPNGERYIGGTIWTPPSR